MPLIKRPGSLEEHRKKRPLQEKKELGGKAENPLLPRERKKSDCRAPFEG